MNNRFRDYEKKNTEVIKIHKESMDKEPKCLAGLKIENQESGLI